MTYEARYSTRNGYWFVDRVEGGEGFTEVVALPSQEVAEAVATALANAYRQGLTHQGQDR